MDGNELYNKILAPSRDAGIDKVRAALAELAEGQLLLTQEEQSFVAGVEATMDMGHSITRRNAEDLVRILKALRQRQERSL